jgi:hypothetical protein
VPYVTRDDGVKIYWEEADPVVVSASSGELCG